MLPKSPVFFDWTSIIYDIFSVNRYIVTILNVLSAVANLLLNLIILSKAEKLFFAMDGKISEQIHYVNKFDVYKEVFEEFLTRMGMRGVIEAKAEKHGISQEQYLQILQSKDYAFLALSLKKCIKKCKIFW